MTTRVGEAGPSEHLWMWLDTLVAVGKMQQPWITPWHGQLNPRTCVDPATCFIHDPIPDTGCSYCTKWTGSACVKVVNSSVIKRRCPATVMVTGADMFWLSAHIRPNFPTQRVVIQLENMCLFMLNFRWDAVYLIISLRSGLNYNTWRLPNFFCRNLYPLLIRELELEWEWKQIRPLSHMYSLEFHCDIDIDIDTSDDTLYGFKYWSCTGEYGVSWYHGGPTLGGP